MAETSEALDNARKTWAELPQPARAAPAIGALALGEVGHADLRGGDSEAGSEDNLNTRPEGESETARQPKWLAREAAVASGSQQPEQQTSPWSFERIYDVFKTPIYNYIYHLVGSREQAEDLTQDTFLKAFNALPGMGADLKLAGWLYRIATNTAYDAMRRRKLIGWLPWQDLDHEPADVDTADPQTTIGEIDQIRTALRRMPPNYRAALILRVQEGFSNAEIAQELGIAESGVKMYLSRARQAFREKYRALEQAGRT